MTEPTLGPVPPSLQALFDRDPLSLTRPEINSIVDELRRQRIAFNQAEGQARSEGKRVNARKATREGGPTLASQSIADLMKDL